MTEKKLVRLVGDIHGKFYDYEVHSLGRGLRHSTDHVPAYSVQVGDFGIGFNSKYWHEQINSWMIDNPTHRFIRGNHDHPDMCKTMAGYIPDGTIENDVMYVGGAWSIDQAYRVEGISWWRDEELSVHELDKLVSLFDETKPRVMITHDCPTSVAYDMFISKNLSMSNFPQIKTRTGEALQAMFELHQPEHWVFGHWHYTRTADINGTKFQCLGELDFIDLEVK